MHRRFHSFISVTSTEDLHHHSCTTPSFVEFHQRLLIWQATLSESDDVLAKSMNFQTAAPKPQYKHRFQWNLVCSKGVYLTHSIPNFSWLLKATPKQSWNVFERVEQLKIGHLSNTKLQLLVDFMSKFRRAHLFYANKQSNMCCSLRIT